MFRIMPFAEMPTIPMSETGRGEQIKFVNPSMGTEKIDVHLNRLVPGGPNGKIHKHSQADNVYIVRKGQGRLIVEGVTHTIKTDDVVYIPAGMKHSLSNISDEVFEIFEIYAPSGSHFDFVIDPADNP